MFGRAKKSSNSSNSKTSNNYAEKVGHEQTPANPSRGGPMPFFFAIIFALSIAETCFTVDSFQYLQRKHMWWSGTERARMGFLIFSCARTILLSAVYLGFHCCVKHLHNMLHTIFLVVSTILWIISGGIIHQMWGYVECANAGVVSSFGEFESQIMGGLTECHEIKIIEIIAWTIAGVSALATVPVVMEAMKRRKAKNAQKHRGGANGNSHV